MVAQQFKEDLNMSPWQDKKVLVTGADGFVGSHLVKRLLLNHVSVVTFSRRGITPPSLLVMEKLIGRIAKQDKGSVIEFEKLKEVLKENKINIVYHLAAQPLVEVGQESPLETFEVNIKGVWNILEAARQNKVKKIIIASTVHVYGDNAKVPFREAYYPQPSRPYETSKACADLLAQTYADTYKLSVEIPRFVNLYGPGDFNFERIVPKVIKAIVKGNNPKIWDLGAVRDFLYIDDAIDAYIMLVEKTLPNTKRGRVFNFGTGKPISILELTKKIIQLNNNKKLKTEIQPIPEKRSKEILRQYVSINKAKKFLDWRPKVSLEGGLKKTLDWYKNYL